MGPVTILVTGREMRRQIPSWSTFTGQERWDVALQSPLSAVSLRRPGPGQPDCVMGQAGMPREEGWERSACLRLARAWRRAGRTWGSRRTTRAWEAEKPVANVWEGRARELHEKDHRDPATGPEAPPDWQEDGSGNNARKQRSEWVLKSLSAWGPNIS